MLTGKLALHDVRDAEALAASVVATSGLPLSFHDHEDLVAYLVATAWELSTRYEPGPRSFSAWCTATLKLRTIDWYRSRRGRTVWKFAGTTYERERPDIVSLDELNPVGSTLSRSSGDSETNCSASLGGLVGQGSSQTDRDIHLIRQLVSRTPRRRT